MKSEPQSADSHEPVILITGGAGFVGQALVRELVKPDGQAVMKPQEIRLFDTREAPRQADARVVTRVGDIRSLDALRRAMEGVDLVFHCAAIIDWGQHPRQLVRSVNVDGTRNVIQACRDAGVGSLVHTSTLDVVYDGRPIVDGDESLPYPDAHVSTYCQTKAEAERLAIDADDTPRQDGRRLRTTVIRPCCVFGEADPYHVSSVLRMARRGPLIRIGDSRSRHQHVYVGNLAHAIALAGRALLGGETDLAGQPFFITDFPPQNFFDYLEPILGALGHRILPRYLGLPRSLMMGLGWAMDTAAELLRPIYRFTPLISRFSVHFVCTDFTLKGDRAREVLGYAPVYTEEEAMQRTIDYFREHGPLPA